MIVDASPGGVLVPPELCAAMAALGRAGLRELRRDGLYASLILHRLVEEMEGMAHGMGSS